MSTSARGVLVLLGLGVALGWPAYAQRPTGSISGTVRDASGAALSGVDVAVSGATIVGTQTTPTGEHGFFRFLGLPPGTYELAFSLAGFQNLKRTGVRVSVGGTTDESVSLAVNPLAEHIEVVASAPVVDTSSNQVSTNYERTWIAGAPLRRESFFDLAAAAPGSLSGGDTNAAPRTTFVYGSSMDENSYQLDGSTITDSFFGGTNVMPNTDAIEEIQILSLGAPAEYGHLTGAVFNIVTRQGTNAFHGDANGYLQTQGLTADNTKGLPRLPDGRSVDSCPSDATKRCPFQREAWSDLTLQLGGPVVKDRLWFFAAYQRQVDDLSYAGLDPATTIDDARRSERYLVKLDHQLRHRHKLQASFHLDHERFPFSGGPNSAPSTAAAYEASRPVLGLAYTGVLSDRTTLEVRYSGFYGSNAIEPADPDQPRGLPHIYDSDTGQHSGAFFFWYDNDPRQSAVTVKASHLADDFLGGGHDFRFGVQYLGGKTAGVFHPNDSLVVHEENGLSYGYGFQSLPLSYSGDARGVSAFVDDTFRVGRRLSLNLGMRYDHEKAFSGERPRLDAAGRPTNLTYPREDHFTWNMFSPRLGFNWKVSSDEKTTLRGHWGRYYRGIATGEWAGSVEQDGQGESFFGDLVPGTLTLTNLVSLPANRNRRVDPGYRAPHMDQFLVTLDRELMPGLGLQMSYVYKRGRHYPAWRDFGGVYQDVAYVDDQGADASGKAITLKQLQNPLTDLSFVLTNRDEMRQDTHAATVTLVRRFSGRLFVNASLTLLRSSGRAGGSDRSGLLQRGGAQFSLFGTDPNDFVNTEGRLGADVPVQVKAQCLYRLPRGFSAALSFSRHAGGNLQRRLNVGDLTNRPGATILGEKLGQLGRLPAVTFLDVRVEKALHLGRSVHLDLTADVLNLLNDDAHMGTVTDLGTAPDYHQPREFVLPRRAILGAKIRF